VVLFIGVFEGGDDKNKLAAEKMAFKNKINCFVPSFVYNHQVP